MKSKGELKESAISEEMWNEYAKTKDIGIRNEIVLNYSGLVKMIAIQMRGTYANYAQVDDIVNQGIIALIDTVEKFDISKGIKFETFASIKIKGAIIDYIRSQDWIPRNLRKIAKSVEFAHDKLWSDLSREPTNIEIAAEMGIPVEKLNKVLEQTYNFNILSYEEVVYEKTNGPANEPAVENIDTPEGIYLENELKNYLLKAVENLNERERTVISLYYYDKLKLKEIAYVLGVTESRVCQMHSVAVIKMKKYLKDYITD